MATRNNKDVKLTLAIEALGQENVDQLKKAVEQLAKEGGAAGPEFKRLADEIERVGQQRAAVATFKGLAEETQNLKTQQAEAAASVSKLATETEELHGALQRAKDAERQTVDALNAGRVARVEAANALREFKAQADSADRSTDAYKARLHELNQAFGNAGVELVALRQANKDATKATREAEQAFNDTEAQLTKASAAAGKLTTALQQQEQALQDAAQHAHELGVNTDDVAASEIQLAAAAKEAVAALRKKAESVRETIENDKLLAIEERALNDLYEKGKQALMQEEAAQRDAAKAVREYTEAKAKAAAEAAQWEQEAFAIVEAAEAAQKLKAQTEALIEERRKVMQQELRDKMQEETAAADELAARMRVWEKAMADADRQAAETAAATKQMADEAKAAGKKIEDAFANIGVKSSQQLTGEIARIRESMATVAASGQLTGHQLKTAFASGEAKIRELELELRKLNGTLTTADKAASLLKNSMGQIAAGNLIADAIASVIEKVKEMGRQFLAAIVQLDGFRRALNAVYKDAATTESQLEFLRKAAERGGVSVGGLSDSFVKFSASMKAANIPIKESNALFDSLTRASGTLGLGAERTSLALDALGQMAAKGVVSMEELRQQLGDSIPGALSLAAKGMGITEAQLVKLVESGNLLARDFFPALTKGLTELHGETTGLIPTWERFKNMLVLTAQNAGDAGWLTLLTGALKVLAGALGIVTMGLSTLSEAMFAAGRAAIVLFETLRGNGKEALEWFNAETEKSVERLANQGRALQTTLGFTEQSAAATATLTTKTQEHMVAAEGSGRAAQAQALAVKLSGDASYDAASKYIQLSVAIAEMLKAQQTETANLEKLLKARKEEGQVLVEVAKLSGDAKMIREAEAKAVQMQYEAQVKLQESKREELNLLKQQLEAIRARLEAANQTKEQIEKETEAVRNKIKTLEAEVEAVDQSTNAAKQVIETQRLLAETYGDQSDKLKDLGAAVNAYKERLEQLLAEERAGKQVAEEIKVIRQQLAEAMYKQRDATNDLIEKVRLEAQAKADVHRINVMGLEGEVRLLEAKAQSARNSGELERATRLEIEAKKKAIEIAKLNIEIKRIELQLEQEEIRIKMDAIDKTDAANATKVKELELRQKLVNAKLKGLDAEKALIDMKEKDINTTNKQTDATNSEAGARQNNTGKIDAETSALERQMEARERSIALQEKEIALKEREDALYRKKWNIDKNGFAQDTAGNTLVAALPTKMHVYSKAKDAGLSDEEAVELADLYSTGNAARSYTDKGWFNDVQEAINNKVLENARKKKDGKGGASNGYVATEAPSGGSSSKPSPSSSGASNGLRSDSNQTVTINLGGRSTTLNMGSQADAQALIGVLRQLETNASTAI